ncbi:MAG TPA: hypothetical protein VD838_18185, partial [Anaeromyxobacteraceae bacterium]|nr:hypothetical protein [Anaeromyxobacteraceae bacterium]
LVRIWRSARGAARPGVFPGLLDGVVEPFLRSAGNALAAGEPPLGPWPRTVGLVRLDPRDVDASVREIEAEWDLLVEVLRASCEALDGEPSAFDWLEKAVATARAGAPALRDRAARPVGIAIAWVWSGVAPSRRRDRSP